MADGDLRIEVLEDEMKVLKGEVSRTLIDLRALLMHEDSPLMAGGLTKRIVRPAEPGIAPADSVNLNMSIDPAAANVSISVPSQVSETLAGLPDLGGVEMPEPPGPSAAPPVNPVPLPSAPSPVNLSPPAVATAPGAPGAGGFSPPGLVPERAAEKETDWEMERGEERAIHRRARLQKEEEDDETRRSQRTVRREAEREEEEAGRERRDRRREREREDDEDRERRNRRRRDEQDGQREEQWKDQNDAGLEDELEDFRRRGEGPSEEIERLSKSGMPAEDPEDGADAESSGRLPEQEAGLDERPMGQDDNEADPDDAEEYRHSPDRRSVGFLPGPGQDREDDHGLGPALDDGGEDEAGNEYPLEIGNGYPDRGDDDWDYPPERPPLNNFDFHEHQEEPKINGNSGSRWSQRPDAGRRAPEDSYYDDRDRGDGPGYQSPPRSRKTPRNPGEGRGGPRSRQPAPGDYGYPPDPPSGYPPNGGYAQWGQPPAGYGRWSGRQEWASEQSPMDLNLVSSLVRWAALAKHRVGEKRLADIIGLYVETRSAPPGLREALVHIASVVDEQVPDSGQTAQETLDLIAHLHGILTAALPVPSVPNIHGNIGIVAGNGPSNGSSSGDGGW